MTAQAVERAAASHVHASLNIAASCIPRRICTWSMGAESAAGSLALLAWCRGKIHMMRSDGALGGATAGWKYCRKN